MDKWSDDQLKKMELGGNIKAKDFFEASPDYFQGMSIKEKYSSVFATQYKEKLAALCEGRPWTPSASAARAPIRSNSAASNRSGSPASNQQQSFGSRNNNNGASYNSNGYNSPSTGYNSPSPGGSIGNGGGAGGMSMMTDKARNEQYFNRLGSENANRSEHLPPSQGGKYAGFGNTPSGPPRNDSLDVNDILNDPAAALSKGWSMLSTTLVAGATLINENVIKPTAATVTDPEFQNKVGGYVSSLGQRVQEGGRTLGTMVNSQINPQASTAGSRSNGRYGGFGSSDYQQQGGNGGGDDFFNSTMNHYEQKNQPPARNATSSPGLYNNTNTNGGFNNNNNSNSNSNNSNNNNTGMSSYQSGGMGISRSNSNSPAPRTGSAASSRVASAAASRAKPAAGLAKSGKKDGWGDDDEWANF
ncbi:Zn finger-containing GTPase- Activating Protein for ARF [Haplosporangium sp. Z 11]|nr:Zn finger-containing GTPase- Activating Protein for ARF [Haplosporangium sp. Z 11]